MLVSTPEAITQGINITGTWADNCIIRAHGDQTNPTFQGSLTNLDDAGNLTFAGTSFYSTATTKTASCGFSSKYWKDVFTDKLYFGQYAYLNLSANLSEVDMYGQLYIYGAESVSPAAIAPALTLSCFQSDYPGLKIAGALGQSEALAIIQQGGFGGTGPFLECTESSDGDKFILTGTGYMGINQPSPSAMLDIVQNAAAVTGLEVNGAANRSAPLLQLVEGSGTPTGDLIQISNKVYVSKDGYVGVNNSTPDSFLCVKGTAASGDSGATITIETGHDSIAEGDILGKILFVGPDSQGRRTGAKITATCDVGGWLTTNTLIAPTRMDFYTQDISGTNDALLIPRMSILESGYIGFGVSTPEYAVHFRLLDPIFCIQDTNSVFANWNSRLRLAESDGDGAVDNFWDVCAGSNGLFSVEYNGSKFFNITYQGKIGFNETSPITAIEWTNAVPTFSFHNSTETDAAGGRACRINARGEQSGGEETMLGFMEFAHDGASDDQKAFWRVGVNAITDGESPTERIRILSSGNVGIGTSAPDKALEINKSTGGEIRLTYNDADGSATNYCDLVTDANGGLTVTTVDSDGAAGNINLKPDGIVTLGDGGITNYAKFASDGELTLTGTARVKRTVWVSAENFKVPSTNPASLIEYGIGYALEFSDEAVNYEYARLRIKVPKDIDTTVQPILVVGWSCPTPDPGNDSVQVRWELAYLWSADDEPMDAAAEDTVTDNYTTSTVAKGLVITEIQLANLTLGDHCFTAILARRSDNAGDTANGVAANVAGACLYYTVDKLGEAT